MRVALGRLHAHPANSNRMSEERLAKLERNVEREGRYPPLIVRPHPELPGQYQLLDGHQRLEVLRRLGHEEALCFPWPCDDATALVLLATLNRLEGEDVPVRRAELLTELRGLLPLSELASLLPEDARAIDETLGLLRLDSQALLAELRAAAERRKVAAPRTVSFVVGGEDEELIERAVAAAASTLSGPNRRGRALALVCRTYLDLSHA